LFSPNPHLPAGAKVVLLAAVLDFQNRHLSHDTDPAHIFDPAFGRQTEAAGAAPPY
jgi:hypothetical protein